VVSKKSYDLSGNQNFEGVEKEPLIKERKRSPYFKTQNKQF
jgi:hypothetical protein